jgi:hypothetical membrane protein
VAAISVTTVTASVAITETMTVRLLLVAAIAATPEITSFLPIVITTVQSLLARTMAALFVIAAVVMFVTVSLAITETMTVRLLDVLQTLRLVRGIKSSRR